VAKNDIVEYPGAKLRKFLFINSDWLSRWDNRCLGSPSLHRCDGASPSPEHGSNFKFQTRQVIPQTLAHARAARVVHKPPGAGRSSRGAGSCTHGSVACGGGGGARGSRRGLPRQTPPRRGGGGRGPPQRRRLPRRPLQGHRRRAPPGIRRLRGRLLHPRRPPPRAPAPGGRGRRRRAAQAAAAAAARARGQAVRPRRGVRQRRVVARRRLRRPSEMEAGGAVRRVAAAVSRGAQAPGVASPSAAGVCVRKLGGRARCGERIRGREACFPLCTVLYNPLLIWLASYTDFA
jgi:hypothetical protein